MLRKPLHRNLLIFVVAAVGCCIYGKESLAQPAVVSKNTQIRAAPPQLCKLLDEPGKRQLMDGLLYNLIWSCGRQAELRGQPGFTGKKESFENGAKILQATDVQVNNPAGESGASTTQSETSLSYNPVTGTYCSAFNDSWEFFSGGGGFTGFARSLNGGASWQDRGAVGATSLGDPSLVWRRADGFFYLATLASGGDLALWRSTDDCGAFTLLSTPSTGGDDKEILAVDNNPASPNYGNLYLVWTDFGATDLPIRASRSTNGGVTWSAPINLSTSTAGGFNQGAWPAVAPNGDVFVAWLRYLDSPSGNINIEMARSTNGGVSYTAVTSPLLNAVGPRDATASSLCNRPALNGNIRYIAVPQIAVDGSGVLHVVYSQDPDTFNSGDVVNVYYRRSTNSGASWSPAIQLNDVATGDQYSPTIQVNGSTLVAGWYDRRNDPGNFRLDYYKRLSVDGGVTWGSNQRLTDVNSPIYLDPGTATCYHGDYDQSVVTATGHVMQWGDDRNVVSSHSDPDVWTDAVALTDSTPPAAPAAFTATGSGTGGVTLTWTASTDNVGVDFYQLSRRTSPTSAWFLVANTSATSYNDTAVAASKMYEYSVMAVDTSGLGSGSVRDYAVTVTFTEDPIPAPTGSGGTTVAGRHVGQLREAVDAWREFAGLPRVYGSYAPQIGTILASHFVGLAVPGVVNAWNEARTALSLTAFAYTGVPAPGPGVTIRKEHVQQLRNASK